MFEHHSKNKSTHDPFAPKKPVPSRRTSLQQLPGSEDHLMASVSPRRQPASLRVTPEVDEQRTNVVSHWVDGPSLVAERAADRKSPAARHTRPQPFIQPFMRDDSFERLTLGDHGEYVSESNAPAALTLPAELTLGMNQAWDKSLPRGRAQEQGGVMVQNQDGTLKWLAGKPGDSKHFLPNFADVKREQTVLSTGHTHPYSQREGGHNRVPFSGQDLNVHPVEDQRLSMVQSGKGLFASARTKEFEELVKSRGAAERLNISAEIEEHWNTIYACVPGEIRQRAEAATRATSAHYHLLYYAGQGGTLTKVDTAIEPRHEECFNNESRAHDTK